MLNFISECVPPSTLLLLYLSLEEEKEIEKMASSSTSLKRREQQPMSREGDQLIVTPLGAGNEVGRSCVYMSFRGKTILVHFPPLFRIHSFFAFAYVFIRFCSSIAGSILPTREWLPCLTSMRLILPPLMSS